MAESSWSIIKRYPPLWTEESSVPDDNNNEDSNKGSAAVALHQQHQHQSYYDLRTASSSTSFLKMRSSSNYWDEFPPEFLHMGHIRPLRDIIRDSLSLGQEVALVSLILSSHQYVLFLEQQDGEQSLFIMNNQTSSFRSVYLGCIGLFTVILIAFYGEEGVSRSTWMKNRTNRLQTRLPDAVLLAILLRMLSSVLRTLTASYSSDTVMLLASSGMVVHLVACNYSYANGAGADLRHRPKLQQQQSGSSISAELSIKRPKFKGGTVSLNAAFFSVTLLASRFQSNVLAFIFVSTSVVAFAFYPDARHRMARRSYCSSSFGNNMSLMEVLVFISLTTSAYIALLSHDSRMRAVTIYTFVQFIVCILGPCTMYYLQHYSRIIIGPWDMANIPEKEDDEDDNAY